MQAHPFVLAWKRECEAMLDSYRAPEPTTQVGTLLAQAGLSNSQRDIVHSALNVALTDAFYTILLGLDGAASLGGLQQSYRIEDEAGNVISEGNGELEAAAFEVFQGAP